MIRLQSNTIYLFVCVQNCVLWSFQEPFEFLPGDEIRVTCEYQTLGRKETIYYGEGTNEEMCYAFITYYPADQKFTYCNNYRTADVCSSNGLDCGFSEFVELATATETQCRAFPLCTKRCKALLEGIKGTQCLEGDNGHLLDDWFPTIKDLRILMEHCSPW
jgi:Copper type II ascorbate-dependent monooxygenase, C-terminal domain